MGNKLYFKLDKDFGEPLQVIANNEMDLREYLDDSHGMTVESIDMDSKHCAVKSKRDKKTVYAYVSWVMNV